MGDGGGATNRTRTASASGGGGGGGGKAAATVPTAAAVGAPAPRSTPTDPAVVEEIQRVCSNFDVDVEGAALGFGQNFCSPPRPPPPCRFTILTILIGLKLGILLIQ